jgi:hypothetical protein
MKLGPRRIRRPGVTDGRPLADLAPKLSPSLWRLRVQNELGTLDEYMPFPADRDYIGAIRERFGAGRWRVRLIRRPGRSTSGERQKLGLAPFRSFEGVYVPEHPGAPAPVQPPPDEDGPRVVQADGEPIEDEAVQQELRAAARVDAECTRIEAEARLKKLRSGLAGAPERGPADAFAVMLEQQGTMFRELLRQSEAREARMMAELQTLRDRLSAPPPAPSNLVAAAAAPAAGLEGLKGSLALVREVLAVADQFRGESGGGDAGDDDSMAGGIVRVLREARGLLGVLPATRGEGVATPSQVPQKVNGQAPQRAHRATAVHGAAATQRRRVELFLAQLLEETEVESDPAAVVDSLGDSIGLLPLPVRAALDRGDWRAAWTACAPFIGPEKWNDLDGVLSQSTGAQTWLAEFAAACVPEDDDVEPEPEEPANAEGTTN